MEPLKIAAQFIAYTWFCKQRETNRDIDPVKKARENWVAFLPYANEGLGQLLIKIGRPQARTRTRTRAAG